MEMIPESPEAASIECTSDLLRVYGERWNIECNPFRPTWSAEKRGDNGSLRLLVAYSPADLAAKINDAENAR
jgi:hypothetical protein